MTPFLAASAWAPLLQTAIGAVAGIGGGVFAHWYTWQKERRSLAAAFAAEIQCFMESINWRDVRGEFKLHRVTPVDEHPFPVFDANIGKIGLLPADLAAKVAVLYTHAGGVVVDLRMLWAVLVEKKINIANLSEVMLRVPKDLDKLEGETNALVPELQKEAARRWRW